MRNNLADAHPLNREAWEELVGRANAKRDQHYEVTRADLGVRDAKLTERH